MKYQFVPGNGIKPANELSRIHRKDVKQEIFLSKYQMKRLCLKKFHIENGHRGREGMYQTIDS